jgi:limonene-1,2-epoxide hydrolase
VPRRNVEELVGFFSADAVYHNIPIAPCRGATRSRPRCAASSIRRPTPSSRCSRWPRAGNKVLTERIDRFTINGKQIAIPVMGTFEIDAQGKISAWRDYFDLASSPSR